MQKGISLLIETFFGNPVNVMIILALYCSSLNILIGSDFVFTRKSWMGILIFTFKMNGFNQSRALTFKKSLCYLLDWKLFKNDEKLFSFSRFLSFCHDFLVI